MTYCLGVLLKDGLVMAADSRTNAGVDYVSSFRKLTVFEEPGERVIALATAGNLATSQAVTSIVSERLGARKGEESIYRQRPCSMLRRSSGGHSGRLLMSMGSTCAKVAVIRRRPSFWADRSKIARHAFS